MNKRNTSKKRRAKARRLAAQAPIPPRTPRPALACLRCGFGARCIEHGPAPFTRCTIKCVYIPDGTWISRYPDKLPDTCGRCHSHSWRIPWTGHGRRPSDPPNPRWLRAEEASANKRLIRQVAREEALQRIRDAEQAEDDAAEREDARARMIRERGPRAVRSAYVPPVSILRVAPDTRRLNAGLSGLPPPPMLDASPHTFTVHRDERAIQEFTDKCTYSAMVELVHEIVASIEPSPAPPEFPEPSPEFLADADRGEESETEESNG